MAGVHALRRRRLMVGSLLVVLGALVAIPSVASAQGSTLRVPQDFATVQAAVDAALAGDLIVVGEGTYHEEVFIAPDHPGNITIRGVDRNKVIFDGRNELGTAIEAQADNVTMENMTAHDYDGNGFYWQSVDGFAGRYLTAYRIGVYAIFSFDSVNGLFEHSYASGSADAAYYVGQCIPCNITLRDLIAEYSALGYSGTNAGGNLVIEDSLWQNNGTGILPNSLTSEANPPQRQAIIRNNVVRNNSNANTPATGLSGSIVGLGIGIAGGNENIVEGNTVEGHELYGIAVFPLPEPTPIWMPENNSVRGNTVSDSGMADLTVTTATGAGNCFEGNTFTSSDPPGIETLFLCDSAGLGSLPSSGSPVSGAVLASQLLQEQSGARERPSYREMPDAPPQPTMPGIGADGLEAAAEDDDDPGAPLATTGGGLALGLAGLALIGSAAALRRR